MKLSGCIGLPGTHTIGISAFDIQSAAKLRPRAQLLGPHEGDYFLGLVADRDSSQSRRFAPSLVQDGFSIACTLKNRALFHRGATGEMINLHP
jgi:hypothetical protein